MALSKGKKLGIIAIIFTTVALAVGGAVFALKNSTQNNGITNNPNNPIVTPDNPTPNNPIVTPDNPTPDKPTPDNPIVTPEDPTPDPEPDVPVIDQTTEAEYKAMFEADLPGVIENYFNENLAENKFQKITNIKLKAYNNFDGTIYFDYNSLANNGKGFMSLNCNILASSESYKELYSKLENIEFSKLNQINQSTQEESLANEIAEFAFEQAEVQNYLAENGLNASDLKVLNVTEFENKSGYLTTNITLKSEKSIFSVKLAGRTGICSTEEEYLTKFKNGYLDNVEIGKTVEYKELETKDAVSYNFNGTASAEKVSYQIVAKHNGQTYVIGEGLDY